MLIMYIRSFSVVYLILLSFVQAQAEEGCANVIDATAQRSTTSATTWTFTATVSSTETGWDKYADEWQVRTLDGGVLGTRTLAHPHVDEQPFTRSLPNVEVSEDVTEVVIAARDSVLGYCGEEFNLQLQRVGNSAEPTPAQSTAPQPTTTRMPTFGAESSMPSSMTTDEAGTEITSGACRVRVLSIFGCLLIHLAMLC